MYSGATRIDYPGSCVRAGVVRGYWCVEQSEEDWLPRDLCADGSRSWMLLCTAARRF